MNKKLFLLVLSAVALVAACGGGASNNTNARNVNVAVVNVNAPVEANVPPANIPADITANDTNSNTRSVTTGNRAVPLGTPAKANAAGDKASRSNAAANSGIPSAEEMRRIMSGQPKAEANKPAMQGPPMMKSNRPLGGRMSANSNQ